MILENIFDAIPTSNIVLASVANQVFSPLVPIVEPDCHTLLGNVVTLTFECEGLVPIDTPTPINRTYITNKLAAGIYQVQVRGLAHCISKGGVCEACYKASRQKLVPQVTGAIVKIDPEFFLQAEFVTIQSGSTTVTLSYSTEQYDFIYIYNDGVLLADSTYTVNGRLLTLSTAVASTTKLTIKYTVISRAPFLYWLAGQYSGSLLGIKELPIESLTLKLSLHTLLIPRNEIESVVSKIESVSSVSQDVREYLPNISNFLEKSLLAIAVDSIFSNVV